MKCVCEVACQVRVNGIIRTFYPGAVQEFDEVPEHFRAIDGPIDFYTAGETELGAAKWTYKQADAAMFEKYGVNLTKGSKIELIRQILDLRFRSDK